MITNIHNLPETILEAVKFDTHRSPGDISVTQIIDAPQIRILKKMHKVDEDVSERVWALMGTAIHHILERANMKDVKANAMNMTAELLRQEAQVLSALPDSVKESEVIVKAAEWLEKYTKKHHPATESKYIFEKTLVVEVDGMTISGTFDLYNKETKTLHDYKLCSIFSYIYPESRKKWNAQINVYAYMLRRQGIKVEKASVIAMFRDWSSHKARLNADHPQRNILEIPVELHPDKLVYEYLQRRVLLHRQAEAGNIIECDGKDRWAKADIWAVNTDATKKALKLFQSELEARTFVITNKSKYYNLYVTHRKGDNARCDSFCPVRDVCPQRKKMLEAKE